MAQGLTAVVHTAALVVVLAGVAKLRHRAADDSSLRLAGAPVTRWHLSLLGVGEIAVGTTVLAVGGRAPALALAAAYTAFTAVSVRQRAAGRDCDCFGAARPVTGLHVVFDGLAAAAALAAVAIPVDGLPVAAGAAGPVLGVTVVATAALAAGLVRLLLTALPDLTTALVLHTPGSDP